MKKAQEKVKVLLECLPYIKSFYGKTVVIKYGGHAMVDEALKNAFALDIVLLQYVGMKPIVVHGGGPQIDELMKKLGKKITFVEGLRVTDRETMDIVEMVLGGAINTEIVSMINKHGGKAIGLSGEDGNMIRAEKIFGKKITEEGIKDIDIGFVGEVESIDVNILKALLDNGFVPVIAPFGVDENGESLNINADTVAGKIAESIKAEKLILLTDTEGVLDRNGKLISYISYERASRMLEEKKEISGGMLPKIKCCIEALKNDVKSCHIIDGRVEHSVLLEIFTQTGVGTKLSMEDE
ncbi:MAG: acetylglutamate kinase [Proteobacteria bacterium]|nr:acetylglutamate kinase [Pseudomonadota bacterium]